MAKYSDVEFTDGDVEFTDGDVLFDREIVSTPTTVKNDYRQMVLNLFPTGKAWTREVGSNIFNFAYAIADELNRIDGRIIDLLYERNPKVTTELIDDYETDLGLPDECSAVLTTLTERRNTAYAKYVASGGLNVKTFEDFATDLGLTVLVVESSPFWCGVGVCGDPCGPQENIFIVLIWIDIGGPLLVPLIDVFQCLINTYKPAHVRILTKPSAIEFDLSFSIAFDSPNIGDTYVWLKGAFDISFNSSFNSRYYGEVGRWDLDEGQGTDVYDSSPLVLANGTFVAAPTWTAWRGGYGLTFDGVADYVDLGSHTEHNFTSEDFFVSVFVNPSALTMNHRILNRGGTTSDGWELIVISNGKVYIRTFRAGNNMNTYTVNSVLTVGVEAHIVVGKIGQVGYIYIDKVAVPVTHDAPHETADTSSRGLYLGCYGNGLSNFYAGFIGAPRIFNRPLYQREIDMLYNNPFVNI